MTTYEYIRRSQFLRDYVKSVSGRDAGSTFSEVITSFAWLMEREDRGMIFHLESALSGKEEPMHLYSPHTSVMLEMRARAESLPAETKPVAPAEGSEEMPLPERAAVSDEPATVRWARHAYIDEFLHCVTGTEPAGSLEERMERFLQVAGEQDWGLVLYAYPHTTEEGHYTPIFGAYCIPCDDLRDMRAWIEHANEQAQSSDAMTLH